MFKFVHKDFGDKGPERESYQYPNVRGEGIEFFPEEASVGTSNVMKLLASSEVGVEIL